MKLVLYIVVCQAHPVLEFQYMFKCLLGHAQLISLGSGIRLQAWGGGFRWRPHFPGT